MRWQKEGIRDSKDANIMLHPMDARLHTLWTVSIQNLQAIAGVSILVYRRMVSNLTALIVLCTLVG
jgi:hypothetical protein